MADDPNRLYNSLARQFDVHHAQYSNFRKMVERSLKELAARLTAHAEVLDSLQATREALAAKVDSLERAETVRSIKPEDIKRLQGGK
jgi:hypothetical protein